MNTISLQPAMSFEPSTSLIDRFCQKQNTSEGEARVRFEETKKFLVICASNRSANYSPSNTVDAMWHEFILHSRDYFSFCELIGGYIHHQPSESHNPEQYTKTIESLRKMFGTIDTTYWTEASADCTSCEGCTGACSS